MDELSKSILEEILKLNITHPKGLNATQFRAKRHEHLDLLDALESDRYLEKKNDNYHLTLLAILELSERSDEAKSLLDKCGHIFQVLRQFYIEHPGEKMYLNSLSEISNMQRGDVNICLAYMVEATIFGGYSIELYADDATVTPAEKILRYRNFRDVLKEIKSWHSKSSTKIKVQVGNIDQTVEHVEDFQFLLHPEIARNALQQYNNGHLREAVLNSIIAVFDLIREKTGLKEDGDKLIGKAFSLKNPYLILSEIASKSGQNDQKGFIQIFKGAYQGIRNPKAHSLSHDLTRLKAAQYLVFASLLARRVDEAKVIKKNTEN